MLRGEVCFADLRWTLPLLLFPTFPLHCNCISRSKAGTENRGPTWPSARIDIGASARFGYAPPLVDDDELWRSHLDSSRRGLPSCKHKGHAVHALE